MKLDKELNFNLQKAKDRLEIVEGLLKALEDIDNIIALIKASENSSVAKARLIEKYNFTENQAKAILAMRLSSLTKLDSIELNKEKEELEDIKLFSIEEIERIMNSGDKQYKFPQNSEVAIKLIKKEVE